MKNILIVVCLCLTLSGCGWLNQLKAHVMDYTFVCVSSVNVIYVQFPTGVAPLYNSDGTLVKCK
jgi:uncharacterized protein YceK